MPRTLHDTYSVCLHASKIHSYRASRCSSLVGPVLSMSSFDISVGHMTLPTKPPKISNSTRTAHIFFVRDAVNKVVMRTNNATTALYHATTIKNTRNAILSSLNDESSRLVVLHCHHYANNKFTTITTSRLPLTR